METNIFSYLCVMRKGLTAVSYTHLLQNWVFDGKVQFVKLNEVVLYGTKAFVKLHSHSPAYEIILSKL